MQCKVVNSQEIRGFHLVDVLMPVREARIDQLDFLLVCGEIAGDFSG